jgi:maltose O-acetyltransferase
MPPGLKDIRPAIAPVLHPARSVERAVARARRRVRYLHNGIEGICMELRRTIDCVHVLRDFGAHVGDDTVVYGPLHIMNAERDFARLSIGDHVYLGSDILIDLADDVTIDDYVSIGMRSNLVTSFDVGPGPLRERRPPKHGPIVLGRGAYLGTGVTILHGVTVGAEATVGAHSLVRKDIPAGATWVTPEGRILEGR